MTNLPLFPSAIYDTYGAVTSTSLGTVITNNAGYIQLAASTSRPYDALLLQLATDGGTAGDCLVTLAIGAAGSEQAIAVMKVSFCFNGSEHQQSNYLLPIAVPAGVRLSLKNVCSNNQDVTAIITGVSGSLLANHGCSYAEILGTTPNVTPNGTLVDPGGTANTLGAWAQITASSPHAYSYITLAVGGNGSSDRGADYQWLVDIGIGAAGSEQVLIQQIFFASVGASGWGLPTIPIAGPYAVSIPAGTRIAVRCQSSNNTLASRELDVGLIGFVR
jgi:hypothetical protein